MYFNVKMQTHVSTNLPLMTLPISYLDTTSLAKWRQTSKENQDTSSIFVKIGWKQYILKHNTNVHTCFTCGKIQKIFKMFQCPFCIRLICGNHVMACKYCDSECCIDCAMCGNCLC